jgi:FG-GAP-like repeat
LNGASDPSQDLAVANANSNSVSVLLGNGDGTFQAPRNFDTGIGPLSVVVGDFNGDGVRDLAVASANSNNVSVLINKTPSGRVRSLSSPRLSRENK